MPSRGLAMLASVTAMMVIACWLAIEPHQVSAPPQQSKGDRVFPQFAALHDTVQSITIDRAGQSYSLSRDGPGWTNDALGGYPASAGPIEQLIGAIATLQYLAPRTQRARLHHLLHAEDVSPTASSTRLSLASASRHVLADLIVGAPAAAPAHAGSQQVYIRLPDSQQVWLALGALDVRRTAADWSERDIIDIKAAAIQSLEVIHTDGEAIVLRRSDNDRAQLQLDSLREASAPVKQYQIDFMAGLLEGVQFDDARAAPPASDAPAITATAHTTTNLSIRFATTALLPNGTVWAQISATTVDPTQSTPEVAALAQRINERFDGWQVRLARRFADRLTIRRHDITGFPAGTNNKRPR